MPRPAGGASVTVVGSGTLVPDGLRSSAAHVVDAREVGGGLTLLDCGSGTLHALDRCHADWAALTHIAISHFHSDHVGDLPALLFALRHATKRTETLSLIGPRGMRSFLDRLAAVLGRHVTDPGFPVRVEELDDGDVFMDEEAGLRLAACSTPHTDESVAYRWEGRGGVVGYTGDTGPSAAVGRFLSGVNVLIAECAQPDPPSLPTHLSPAGAAELAALALPRTLVLTHAYPPATTEEMARAVGSAGYGGVVIGARDGLRVPLEP